MKISQIIELLTHINDSYVLDYLEYLSLPVLPPSDEDDIKTSYLPGQLSKDYKLFIKHEQE